ncbi:MAG TPA: G8 domain-containing protein [Tepidisphaeraceae bacterium]|jgi:hypothetical protein|nr:G8 domain-containing protein [Tepidisphaeraceae bacterium]
MGWKSLPGIIVALSIVLLGGVSSHAANVTFDARSAHSGNWSDPHTWADGRVPKAGDFVQIRAGDTVTYDVNSDATIRMVHVAGTLTFSREKSTKLRVGLIKIQAGTTASEEGFDCDAHGPTGAGDSADSPRPVLEIGTLDNPIPANVTATIQLAYIPGTDPQTLPAIMDCGGTWDVHGAPMARTWVKLAEPCMTGSDTVALAEDPGKWKSGDRIVLTGSYNEDFQPQRRSRDRHVKPIESEERLITVIDGTKLTLDKPVEADHICSGPERTEAANLSRNVIIESADPTGVRGHTMYHAASSGGISYAEFRHLGKKGVLGKYPIHFHLVRDSMRGSAVVGASIWDSQNRFMAIHGTDYLLVRDCVGYRCIGHGFFLEDATEQYNILDHNIAIRAEKGKQLPKQALDFDANEGAGFWWANGRNSLTRNVATECGLYGYKFQIEKPHGKAPVFSIRQPDGSFAMQDIRHVPFLRCDDNESHTNGLYAFNFGDDPAGSVHSDVQHPFIARNLRVWQEHYALRPNTQDFLMDGLTINHAVYGVYHPDYANHVYRNIYLNTVIAEPINRGHDDESIQYGSFTYENLTLENCHSGYNPPIQLTCTSPLSGQSGHFKNVVLKNTTSDVQIVDLGGGPRNDKLENAVPYYFHDYPRPGTTTKVVSVHFPQNMTDGVYKSIKGFTGPDVRATEIPEVPFPELLHPIDDLPPATIITNLTRTHDGKVAVTGVSEDNGDIESITVNDRPAAVISSANGIVDWQINLDVAAGKPVEARATDKAGNVEKMAAIRPAP